MEAGDEQEVMATLGVQLIAVTPSDIILLFHYVSLLKLIAVTPSDITLFCFELTTFFKQAV